MIPSLQFHDALQPDRLSSGKSIGFVDFAAFSFEFESRSLRFDEAVSGAKLVRLPGSRFGPLQPRAGAELAFDKANIAPLPSVPKKGQVAQLVRWHAVNRCHRPGS
jgi:hypothetical protein